MGLDKVAFKPQQRSSAITFRVDPAPQRRKGTPRQKGAGGTPGVGLQLPPEFTGEEFHERFPALDADVSHEAVTDEDVGFTAHDVVAFNVADKIETALLEQVMSRHYQFVALGFFFADGKKSHTRRAVTKHDLDKDTSHDGELE